MSTALNAGVIEGSTAAGTAPVAPLDPDHAPSQQMPAMAGTVGRMNTYDVHQNLHKYNIDQLKWTPLQKPGYILKTYKNHPSIHPYFQKFYRYYKYWCGGFRLTFRICGSGLVGGALRFAVIPPHISDEEIASYSLQQMTYYDAMDMDPKTLVPVSISMEDINSRRMHVNTGNMNDPDGFGSRVIVYVYGQLQAQIGEVDGLTVIVECEVEDFAWSTFIPGIADVPTSDFSDVGLKSFSQSTSAGAVISQLRTTPGTTRVITSGFGGLVKSNGVHYLETSFPYSQNYVRSVGVGKDDFTDAATTVQKQPLDLVSARLSLNLLPGKYQYAMFNYYTAEDYSGTGASAAMDAVKRIDDVMQVGAITLSGNIDNEKFEFKPPNSERVLKFVTPTMNLDDKGNSTAGTYSSMALDYMANMSLLGKFKTLNEGECLLFSLRDLASGETLNFLKYYPEGVFCMIAGSEELAMDPTTLGFVYERSIPRTEFIPTNLAMKMYTADHCRTFREKRRARARA